MIPGFETKENCIMATYEMRIAISRNDPIREMAGKWWCSRFTPIFCQFSPIKGTKWTINLWQHQIQLLLIHVDAMEIQFDVSGL